MGANNGFLLNNSPFASSPKPLHQSDASCRTIHYLYGNQFNLEVNEISFSYE